MESEFKKLIGLSALLCFALCLAIVLAFMCFSAYRELKTEVDRLAPAVYEQMKENKQ